MSFLGDALGAAATGGLSLVPKALGGAVKKNNFNAEKNFASSSLPTAKDAINPADYAYGDEKQAEAGRLAYGSGDRIAPSINFGQKQTAPTTDARTFDASKTGINTGTGGPGSYKAQVQNAGDARDKTLAAVNQQKNAVALERAAAEGKAPSAAQIQSTQGTQDAAAAQIAAANSARGGVGAQIAAARNAALQGSALQRNNIRDNAALRANEMATARGQYQAGTEGVTQAEQGVRQQDITQAGQGLDLAKTQAGLNQQTELQNSQVAEDLQKSNNANTLETNKLNATLEQQTKLANLDAQLKEQGLNDEQRALYLQSYQHDLDREQAGRIGANQTQVNLAMGLTGLDEGIATGNVAAQNAFTGDLIGGAAGLGSAAIKSDKRSKRDIKNLSHHDIHEMLDKTKAKSFNYKDDDSGEPKRAGVIAQDLLKSKTGKQMVVKDHMTGVLGIDVNRGLSTALAALSDIEARLAKIEKRKRG